MLCLGGEQLCFRSLCSQREATEQVDLVRGFDELSSDLAPPGRRNPCRYAIGIPDTSFRHPFPSYFQAAAQVRSLFSNCPSRQRARMLNASRCDANVGILFQRQRNESIQLRVGDLPPPFGPCIS